MATRRSAGTGRGRSGARKAFSLAEALVVIAVIGVLSALVIPNVGGTLASSQANVAQRNLNLLNGAVLQYNQSIAELTNSPGENSEVIALLKTRDTTVPGTPFLASHMASALTDSSSTYRANWNGRVFALVLTGTGGSGIDLLKMSSSQ